MRAISGTRNRRSPTATTMTSRARVKRRRLRTAAIFRSMDGGMLAHPPALSRLVPALLLAALGDAGAAPRVPLSPQPADVAWPTRAWPTGPLPISPSALEPFLAVTAAPDPLLGE